MAERFPFSWTATLRCKRGTLALGVQEGPLVSTAAQGEDHRIRVQLVKTGPAEFFENRS